MAVRVTAVLRLAARAAFAAMLVATPAGAQLPRASEYAVKAAFLFQFTRFVRWPEAAFPAPDAPFRLCVWGADPFGSELARIEGNRYGTHPIQVERPRRSDALRGCHLVYIGEEAPLAPGDTVRMLDRPGVLTVSSEPGFAEAGGALEFVIRENRVRMVINARAVREGGLSPSAKLLEVAERVVDGVGGGP